MAETDPLDLPDDFDRLLRQELSIEPSPAFAARVRADAAARPRPFWTAWLLPLAGAVALAVAVFVWMPRADEPAGTLPLPVPAPPVVANSTPAQVEPVPTDSPDRAVSSIPSVQPRSQRPARPATPVSARVVVDQDQRAALTILVAMIDRGRLTADAFAKTTPQSTDSIADQVVPITIAPVTVSTISPGGVLQNDTQRK